jgi:hypothetical protein
MKVDNTKCLLIENIFQLHALKKSKRNREVTNCTLKEIDFSVFLIRKLAEAWGKSTPETYKILTDTNIMDDYILKSYDVLHTLGAEYLVEDVTEFVHEKGIAV